MPANLAVSGISPECTRNGVSLHLVRTSRTNRFAPFAGAPDYTEAPARKQARDPSIQALEADVVAFHRHVLITQLVLIKNERDREH